MWVFNNISKSLNLANSIVNPSIKEVNFLAQAVGPYSKDKHSHDYISLKP